jgi:hypothetical protein
MSSKFNEILIGKLEKSWNVTASKLKFFGCCQGTGLASQC